MRPTQASNSRSPSRLRVRMFVASCLAASVGWAATARADVAGTVTQLGTRPGWTQKTPAIAGSWVLWTDSDGVDGRVPKNYEISFQDANNISQAPINLTETPDVLESQPDLDRSVDANNIASYAAVWKIGPPAAGDIVLYDISAGTRATLASATSTVRFDAPAISGPYVVYERIDSQRMSVMLFDRTKNGTVQLPSSSVSQFNPRISGDFVVYESWDSPAQTTRIIQGYHYATPSSPFVIAASARNPDVDGNKVVYVGQDTSGGDQVFLYDDAAKTTRQLTTVASNKSWPRISGTHVVWNDDRNGGRLDLFSYDLSTNVEDNIPTAVNVRGPAAIDGFNVAFAVGDANGNASISVFSYSQWLSFPAPEACDPNVTDIVDGPFQLIYYGNNRPATLSRSDTITPKSGYSYYICLVNGRSDGSRRATTGIVTVEARTQLPASDFAAGADGKPPAQIGRRFTFPSTLTSLSWGALLPAQPNGAMVTVSIRVSKAPVN
jgi:beta propeller repeat protein